MSNYYSVTVGFVHDEDYEGFIELCEKLKALDLLDDYNTLMVNSDIVYESDNDIMFELFKSIKNDENPYKILEEKGLI